MKLKHLNHLKAWNDALKSEFNEYMYTHERNDKTGSKKYMSNCSMPIDIFDNKRKFSQLLNGSEYYPSGIDALESEELVIIKKPKGCCGEGHIISMVKDVGRAQRVNCDIQQLIQPLLINNKKFHLRILMGFDTRDVYMPWENCLVLVNPNSYTRGDMTTEITNSAFNGSESIFKFNIIENVLKDNGLYDDFVSHMQMLKDDLKNRYRGICKGTSFDIHGLDVIISETGKPIVMETNPYWYSGKDKGWEDKMKMFKKIMIEISRDPNTP